MKEGGREKGNKQKERASCTLIGVFRSLLIGLMITLCVGPIGDFGDTEGMYCQVTDFDSEDRKALSITFTALSYFVLLVANTNN